MPVVIAGLGRSAHEIGMRDPYLSVDAKGQLSKVPCRPSALGRASVFAKRPLPPRCIVGAHSTLFQCAPAPTASLFAGEREMQKLATRPGTDIG